MNLHNPILDELHMIREQLLAESGGTLDGLIDRLQAEQRSSDRPVWSNVVIMKDGKTSSCESPNAVAFQPPPN